MDVSLTRFNAAKELHGVGEPINFAIRTDDFLTFADSFLDGLLTDWLMQRKINDANQQVTEAIGRVRYVRRWWVWRGRGWLLQSRSASYITTSI